MGRTTVRSASKGSLKKAEVLKQLPKDMHPIAGRLIAGSCYVYRQFARHQVLVASYKKRGIFFTPSLAFRARILFDTFWEAMLSVASSVTLSIRDYHALIDQPTNLQDAQRPLFAIAGCSDSRVQTLNLLDMHAGEAFGFENIGGSLEDPQEPSRLSKSAEAFICFAKHMGVKDFILVTHGKCGCISNAVNPCHHKPLDPAAPLEAVTLREMALEKKYIVDIAQEKGIQHYLGMLDAPQLSESDKQLLALEIAHGLHNMKLAKDFIAKLTLPGETPMRVTLIHKELRTLDPYIFNPETKKFVRLTQHPPLADMDGDDWWSRFYPFAMGFAAPV
ncbi:MAG: carbonic anhydrase [Alphaproteobacteria bacterium]|nr:carbonic anhydrase [Alphaproteobacteria bacterium]